MRGLSSVIAGAAAVAVLAGSVPGAGAASELPAAQWYLGPMGLTAAHRITTGTGVKVAVIDSGVDASVPDLAGAVVDGHDFSGEGSANGQQPVGEGSEHGTGVASVLAGRAAVVGAAPSASLLSASVDVYADSSGSQILQALRWSADHGAKVVNLSVGGQELDPDTNPQARDVLEYVERKDVVVVAAAGNHGTLGTTFPCGAPGVLCVGGVDRDDAIDPDSSRTDHMVLGPYATAAHAEHSSDYTRGIPVAVPAGDGTLYNTRSGTSFASPVVAGVAALIRARYPNLDAANVVNRIIRTATPLGGDAPNATYGYGLADAERALTADVAPVEVNPLGSLVAAESSASPSTSATPSSAPSASGARSGSASTSRGATKSDNSTNGFVVVVIVAALAVGIGWQLRVAARRRRRRAWGRHDRP